MGWAESLQDASFKGVKFEVLSTRDEFDRDVAEFLYPYRSGGTTDDMGRGLRRFDLIAVFNGDDYMQQLQTFLAKIDEPGSGELIHPIYGSIPKAQFKRASIQHEAERVDYCTVRLTFLEDGQDNPFFVQQLPSAKADAAKSFTDIANELGTNQFLNYMAKLKAMNPLTGILTRLNAIKSVMGDVLGSIHGVISSYVTSAVDLIDYPSAFVSDLGAGIAGLVDLRGFSGDSIMPDWSGLVDDMGDVVLLPASTASGNLPTRFATTTPAQPIPTANAADVAAMTALAQTATASALAGKAADILADQADTPTLSPADIEQIADDVRASLQAAIDTARDSLDLETARPIMEALRTAAGSIQDAAAAVIDVLPPLQLRQVDYRANLRLLAFFWYGDHARAVELARLNPLLRDPNALNTGDQVYGFLR